MTLKFYEKHKLLGIKNKTTTYKVYEVEQPLFYRVRARIVSRLDRLTYTLPRFKKLWAYAFHRLNTLAEKRHRRTCNNDCGFWYVRNPNDPPGKFEFTEDRKRPGCVRMPLEARWDCWIYHLENKHSKVLNTYTLDKPA